MAGASGVEGRVRISCLKSSGPLEFQPASIESPFSILLSSVQLEMDDELYYWLRAGLCNISDSWLPSSMEVPPVANVPLVGNPLPNLARKGASLTPTHIRLLGGRGPYKNLPDMRSDP